MRRAWLWWGGAVVGALVLGLALGYWWGRPRDRWQYIQGPQGLVYRADRHTGETFMTWPARREWLAFDPHGY